MGCCASACLFGHTGVNIFFYIKFDSVKFSYSSVLINIPFSYSLLYQFVYLPIKYVYLVQLPRKRTVIFEMRLNFSRRQTRFNKLDPDMNCREDVNKKKMIHRGPKLTGCVYVV